MVVGLSNMPGTCLVVMAQCLKPVLMAVFLVAFAEGLETKTLMPQGGRIEDSGLQRSEKSMISTLHHHSSLGFL